MKKGFKYIENLWLGEDGKPSVKRVLAVLFSLDLIRNINRSINPISKAMKLLTTSKTPDANVITAIGSFLSNIQLIIGIEASVIISLLGIAAYSAYKTGTNKDC